MIPFIRKIKFTALLILFTICTAKAQEGSSDSLVCVRKLFTSKVYLHSTEVSPARFTLMLNKSLKWSRKRTISRIILPAGPVVTAGGIYLAYDAIKGIPMEAVVDGVTYPYTKRNLPELLTGLALFVTGLSMVESANETTQNAVNWYNSELNKKASAVKFSFGFSNTGGLALKANF